MQRTRCRLADLYYALAAVLRQGGTRYYGLDAELVEAAYLLTQAEIDGYCRGVAQ